MSSHHFAVTDLLPNGRLLVTIYARRDDRVLLRMLSFDDNGQQETHLHVDMEHVKLKDDSDKTA